MLASSQRVYPLQPGGVPRRRGAGSRQPVRVCQVGRRAVAAGLGYASDRLRARYGAESLHYAIVGGTGFYVLAAVLLLLAARRLARDFEPE